MMKSIIVATVLLAFASFSFGADAPINTMCPMCQKEVPGTKPSTVHLTVGEGADAKHMKMAFCSEKCCDEFKKDPAKTLGSHVNKPGSGTQFKP
jgi:hypothetical protein